MFYCLLFLCNRVVFVSFRFDDDLTGETSNVFAINWDFDSFILYSIDLSPKWTNKATSSQKRYINEVIMRLLGAAKRLCQNVANLYHVSFPYMSPSCHSFSLSLS